MQKFENQPISGVTSMAASQHCLEILLILVTKLYKYSFFIIWAHVMCNYLLYGIIRKNIIFKLRFPTKKISNQTKIVLKTLPYPSSISQWALGVSTPPLKNTTPSFLPSPPIYWFFNPPPPHPPLKLDLSLNPKNIKVFHP